MPIEIKEVVIRTTVEKGPASVSNKLIGKEEFNRLKKDILKNCEAMIHKEFKLQSRR